MVKHVSLIGKGTIYLKTKQNKTTVSLTLYNLSGQGFKDSQLVYC